MHTIMTNNVPYTHYFKISLQPIASHQDDLIIVPIAESFLLQKELTPSQEIYFQIKHLH